PHPHRRAAARRVGPVRALRRPRRTGRSRVRRGRAVRGRARGAARARVRAAVTGRRAFDALLALCAGVVLAFLALPLVALVTEVPPGDLPSLLDDAAVVDALAVTARTNAIANVLILALGTPTAYLLATRRFRG